MAASGTVAAAAIILALVNLAAAQNAQLEILPSGEVQSRKINSMFVLTCQPTSGDANVISDMKWLDPQNRTIEPLSSKNPATTGSDMYTEMQQDKSLTLYFTSLKEQEAGRYTCVANYASTENLSKSVMIETIESLKWIDAPENQYPILGKSFKIKCHVSSRPSPSVAWFLDNGTQISTGNHYVIETHALTIKNVVYSDEGVYKCRATVLQTGEFQERAIRVEILEEPKIKEMGNNPVEIIEGKTETILCEATGKPLPKYSWVKSVSSQNLSEADRFGVEKDTGALTITNVHREDEGEYECIASNAAGQAKSLITVVVNVKPKIMEFFNTTVAVGKTVDNITCKAFGRPVPQVTFRKHGSMKPYVIGPQQDDDRIVLTNTVNNADETIAVLTINNVLRDDDGLYECIATNKVATAYKNGHLTVEFPPSFRFMTNKTVLSWDQRPVNLTCIAESIPNATIRWTLGGGAPIDFDRDIKQIGNGPISTLMITRVDNRYYGYYKCIAGNPHGTSEISIQLKQGSRPSQVQQAKVSEITATTVAFDITPPPFQDDLPLRSITVQYREQDTAWSNAKNKTWSIGSPYILEGLKPQTYYNFRFLATNDVGDGNWGATLLESTPMRTYPNIPKIRRQSEDSPYDSSRFNTEFELQWLAPPDNGEPIDLYEIRYCQVKRAGQDWETVDNTCKSKEIKGQRSKDWLRDLNSDTFYRAEVRAHNIIGYGNPGVLHFKTARGETQTRVQQAPLISSATIIGIVIAVLFLVIVVIDVICCCTHKTGIIFYVCERSRKKPVDEEDTKLGREEKEPLKEEKKITPIIDSGLRRETSITFDGKRSVSKTGFVGKDSAV